MANAHLPSPFKVYSKTRPNPLPHFEGTRKAVTDWLKNNMCGPGFHVYNTGTETYQEVREFLEENNPFVSKFYRMDPETDDLIPNGNHLANGMKVLLADPTLRQQILNKMTEWQEDRAHELNRWCIVGALEVIGAHVRFIGVYDDGSKRMITRDIDSAWLVKKDSVREVEDKSDKVQKLVTEAMMEALHTTVSAEPDALKGSRLEMKAADITHQIMNLL